MNKPFFKTLAEQLGLIALSDFHPDKAGPDLPVNPTLMARALAKHRRELIRVLIKAQRGQLSARERRQFRIDYSAKIKATYTALLGQGSS